MFRFLACFVGVSLASAGWAQTVPPNDKPREPRFIDDQKQYDDFIEKLVILVKAKKCLSAADLQTKYAAKPKLKSKIDLAKPNAKVLEPEDVYDAILPSVVILGSVKPSEDDPNVFEEGGIGTAFCIGEGGLFATNSHMFANSKHELFGIATNRGTVHPVVDLLAVDPLADVAIFKVEGANCKPLPLSEKPARVGSWVATLGHPGNQLFTFTQGRVTRYSKEKTEAGLERWMAISADYAQGSSGGPIVDRYGNVVGMAALTVSIDAFDEPQPDGKPPEKPLEKPKPKPEEMASVSSTLQMVVKLTVPLGNLRSVVGGP